MQKIEQNIKSVSVISKSDTDPVILSEEPAIKGESVIGKDRESDLQGTTYKIKAPLAAVATYITINNMTLNKGTPEETIVPFEIFINSKEVSHQQWITALTRLISATFRRGGDFQFVIDELEQIADPAEGGYMRKGRYIPGLVAEIGIAISRHLDKINYGNPVADYTKPVVAAELEEEVQFPEHATLCPACNHKAVVVSENCAKCLNCSDSKCG